MATFDIHEMAKKCADIAMDEFLFEGKSVREWMQIIASGDYVPTQAVKDAIAEINEEINKQSSIPYYTAGSIQISDIGVGLKIALDIINKHTGVEI